MNFRIRSLTPMGRSLSYCVQTTRRQICASSSVTPTYVGGYGASSTRSFSKGAANWGDKPWEKPMPEAQFQRMKSIISAPSPIGMEAAMTVGVLKPLFENMGGLSADWEIHQFQGNAGLVLDTHPGRDDLFSVMVVGHADKIRMQVKSISSDGKIWIESDSFLPLTLIGNEVVLFAENPESPGSYRGIQGGTIEALGAIHFASPEVRSGKSGIKTDQLYLELQLHGEKRKEQAEALGIRAGDSIILDRKIKRGFAEDTFYGAYLDNGLGCFVAAETANLLSSLSKPLDNTRVLFAFASHEEIGRFGSRVLAGQFRPDCLIAIDVNHDYVSAPGVSQRKFQPLEMGKGFTTCHGSIASFYLNQRIEQAAAARGLPFQRDIRGRDTGTDAMAAVLASVDSAATSLGICIRNMHTVSETGHTGDVLATIYALLSFLEDLEGLEGSKQERVKLFKERHPRLDQAEMVGSVVGA